MLQKSLLFVFLIFLCSCATTTDEKEVYRSGTFWKITFKNQSRYPAATKLSYRVYAGDSQGAYSTPLEIGPPYLSQTTRDFLAVSASGPGDDIFPAILVFTQDGNDGIKAFRIARQGHQSLIEQL